MKKFIEEYKERSQYSSDIDKKMAAGFSIMVLILMLILLFTATVFYQRTIKTNDDQLQETITGILADSINRISFSGKYHASLLIEQITRRQKRIGYIFILDSSDKIMAHSNPEVEHGEPSRDLRRISHRVLKDQKTHIREKEHLGRSVTEIAMLYHSGYEDDISGVIFVGIYTDLFKREVLISRFLILGVIALLTLFSLITTYYLSKYFAAPMKSMALQLKGILEYAPVAIMISNKNKLIRTSEEYEKVKEKGEVKILQDEVENVFLSNKPVSSEIILNISDEEKRFSITSFPIIKDDYGNTQLACSIAYDISERILAMERLKEKEEDLRITLNSIGDAVITTDAGGLITRMNPVAEELTGSFIRDVRGAPFTEVFTLRHGPQMDEIENPIDKIIYDGSIVPAGELLILVDRFGTERQIESNGSLIRNPDGNIIGVVLVMRDVTLQRQMEVHLRQSQRMESIGQLAGGIAHDFNNMLSGMIGYAQLLENNLKDEKLKSYAGFISTTVNRAADLTSKLLSFSRKGKLFSTSIDVNGPVHEAIGLIERSIDKKITLKKKFTAERSVIVGDPSQLQNAILNLCINARDAMFDGGVLTIFTENIYLDESYCLESPFDLTPGYFVRIRIEDTGVGMDEETINRIFEPFFTTKEIGKGTGLGLAAVYGTVSDHHGAIDVHSEPGKGTRFDIFLPVSSEEFEEQETSESDIIRGEGCILVVDDEKIIRTMTFELLSDLGYEVILAENGEAGVEAYRKNQNIIDLCLVDMVMPKMNGKDCFRNIREIDPTAKIIICSGFTRQTAIEDLYEEGLMGFIKKPFTSAELGRAVSNALAVRK